MIILSAFGDSINSFLDNLISITWRLIDLPMFLLVIIITALFLIINFIMRKWIFKKVSANKIKFVNIALAVLLCALIIDKKFRFMKSEINVLNEKVMNAQLSETSGYAKEKDYDLSLLKNAFPGATIYEKTLNEAMDLITIKKENPNAVLFIAIINLEHPGIVIKITDSFTKKFLTSEFAKNNNCEIAVNGEAGETMAQDGELGEWSGNWIVNGNPVMMVDNDLRPFMSFSKQNKPTYFKASIVDTTNTPEKYNTIWGRFDILINNEVILQKGDKVYAQTVIGINETGSTLYLMVVDGKRPDYSIGLTYFDCATMLQSLGASYAMACDRGGSSCMYIKNRGIINRPADSDGYERNVYTHFGVAMR